MIVKPKDWDSINRHLFRFHLILHGYIQATDPLAIIIQRGIRDLPGMSPFREECKLPTVYIQPDIKVSGCTDYGGKIDGEGRYLRTVPQVPLTKVPRYHVLYFPTI